MTLKQILDWNKKVFGYNLKTTRHYKNVFCPDNSPHKNSKFSQKPQPFNSKNEIHWDDIEKVIYCTIYKVIKLLFKYSTA